VYGRYGEDLGTSDGATPPSYSVPYDGVIDSTAQPDTGDLIDWLVTFDSMQVTHTSEITGFEMMQLRRLPRSTSDRLLEWTYGIRYLQIKESLGMSGTGGFLGSTVVNTRADNDIIGPQIGVRWRRQAGFTTLAAEGRFLAAINIQRADQVGQVATLAEPGGQNQPVSLNALSFNSRVTNHAFTPLGEFRFETICHVNPWVGLRFGYTGMVAGGISRASEKVVYALPRFQLTDSASHEVILSSALTFGVEINR